MNDLTLENFHVRTGFRFRISTEQNQRIKAGTLTREGAFQEFLAQGGAIKRKSHKPAIPQSIYLVEGLTVDNFSQTVKDMTGTARRFRMNREQCARHKSGLLTREEALAEIVQSVKSGPKVQV